MRVPPKVVIEVPSCVRSGGEACAEMLVASSGLSCRSLVTQDVLDYCCGVGGYVGLGGDGLTGDLDGDLA